MRNAGKTRMSERRRTTNRKNFLRLERLESRYALTASPVAMNDFYHDLVNQPLEIPAAGILSNDSSPSGDALTAGLFSVPSHGTLEVNEDGSFVYTPEADYMGLDSFLYFANDGVSDSMLAAVTIDVGDGGPPPDRTHGRMLSVAFREGQGPSVPSLARPRT